MDAVILIVIVIVMILMRLLLGASIVTLAEWKLKKLAYWIYDIVSLLEGKGARIKKTKKSINDGFMYVCVAEKCEMMDFYFGFFYSSFYRQFSVVARKKNEKWWIFMYVCMCKAKSIIDGFFCFFCTFPLGGGAKKT